MSLQSDDLPCTMARNILCFGYNICWDNSVIPPHQNNRMMAHNKSNLVSSPSVVQVIVSPNPAKEYAKFNYKISLPSDKTLLIITDINGITICQFDLTTPQGELVWNTKEVSNGVYLYKITDDNDVIRRGKIVVEK